MRYLVHSPLWVPHYFHFVLFPCLYRLWLESLLSSRFIVQFHQHSCFLFCPCLGCLFCPLPPSPSSSVDVINISRRDEQYHQLLLLYSISSSFFFFFKLSLNLPKLPVMTMSLFQLFQYFCGFWFWSGFRSSTRNHLKQVVWGFCWKVIWICLHGHHLPI